MSRQITNETEDQKMIRPASHPSLIARWMGRQRRPSGQAEVREARERAVVRLHSIVPAVSLAN